MEGALILPTLHTCFFPRQLINKDYTHGSFALGNLTGVLLLGSFGRRLEGVEWGRGIHVLAPSLDGRMSFQ